MIPIGAGISAAAAVVVSAAVLTAVLISPVPTPPQTVWFDQPDNYATVAAGGTVIAMHASSERTITQFRLVVTRDGDVVTVLNDTSPDAVLFGSGARPLVSGSTQWVADPGTYRLTVSYLDASGWVDGVPVQVTVPAGDFVLPTLPDGIQLPKPTNDPTPEPTESAEPEFEEPPVPDAPAPTIAPPSATPTATPTTPPVAATPPSGTVRRTVTGVTTKFVAEGVLPSSAYVDVQVQITAGYNTASQPSGTWQSVGCGNLTAQAGTSPTKYSCTTSAWTPGSQSSSYRTGHVRVVVTSGGQTSTSYGSDWLIDPQVN